MKYADCALFLFFIIIKVLLTVVVNQSLIFSDIKYRSFIPDNYICFFALLEGLVKAINGTYFHLHLYRHMVLYIQTLSLNPQWLISIHSIYIYIYI